MFKIQRGDNEVDISVDIGAIDVIVFIAGVVLLRSAIRGNR